MKLFLKYARLPGNLIRAFKVACAITPVLTLMNHWGEIAAMRLDFIFWLQMLLTFTVPFSVSLFSSAMTSRAEHLKESERTHQPG